MPNSEPRSATVEPVSLPVVGEIPERGDAARNRAKILEAAESLIAERGVAGVSTEAICDRAGVGKGTLFRRFGDRAGLMQALLSERDRQFQEEVIRGEPPLGPGAGAVERLVAFGRRMIQHLERHGDLMLAAEALRSMQLDTSPYSFWGTHMAILVREAAPGVDVDYLADALLAPLSPDFYLYQRRVREFSPERIADSYEQLVRRLFPLS